MAEANQEYEQRFGHIFIVCATGKSAPEILEILRRRLQNDEAHRTSRSGRAATADHTYPADKMALGMKRISTHVLDTALGKPATGVPVRLERRENIRPLVAAGTSAAPIRTDAAVNCLPDETSASRRALSSGV